MDKEFGKKELEEVINMKGSGLLIKNKDMVSLLGQMVVYIKEILSMILKKGQDKCNMLMGQSSKVNGVLIDLSNNHKIV